MELRPEEITKIIRSQIKNYENKLEVSETGVVILVGDGIARVSGLDKCMAGELVVRTVKLEIMHKANELDLCAFDLPAFYEKLENANREAGMRPIEVIRSTFSIVSNIISVVSFIVGIILSYSLNTPAGAGIVCVNIIAFGFFSVAGYIKSKILGDMKK